MATISIIVSMYDRSRRAAVTLPVSTSVEALMAECSRHWALPADSFVFRILGSNRLLIEGDGLWEAGVDSGSELQIFPIAEGG